VRIYVTQLYLECHTHCTSICTRKNKHAVDVTEDLCFAVITSFLVTAILHNIFDMYLEITNLLDGNVENYSFRRLGLLGYLKLIYISGNKIGLHVHSKVHWLHNLKIVDILIL
jgi:hypothetical protein